MAERGGGSIIMVGSIAGLKANTIIGAYGISKAADHMLVKNLAAEFGPKNIRVNAISAGPVRTLAARSITGFGTMESICEERSPLHRQIDADDVGAAAAKAEHRAAHRFDCNIAGEDEQVGPADRLTILLLYRPQ